MSSGGARYTFGDGSTAARRLAALAELYGPSSAELLREAVAALDRPVRVALDIGCAFGATTTMVQRATRAKETIGLERSEAYLQEAHRSERPGMRFVQHDVSRTPLPCPPADLAYARFLLTHLEDPREVLAGWRTAIAPGGLLVLEELEILRSPDATLTEYYRLIEALQADQGQIMYIGPELGEYVRSAGFEVVRSVATPIPVTAAAMAHLHRANLETVRREDFVRRHWTEAQLDRLSDGLERIASERSARTPIEDVLRQIVARVDA